MNSKNSKKISITSFSLARGKPNIKKIQNKKEKRQLAVFFLLGSRGKKNFKIKKLPKKIKQLTVLFFFGEFIVFLLSSSEARRVFLALKKSNKKNFFFCRDFLRDFLNVGFLFL
jgi:hypothetical protein